MDSRNMKAADCKVGTCNEVDVDFLIVGANHIRSYQVSPNCDTTGRVDAQNDSDIALKDVKEDNPAAAKGRGDPSKAQEYVSGNTRSVVATPSRKASVDQAESKMNAPKATSWDIDLMEIVVPRSRGHQDAPSGNTDEVEGDLGVNDLEEEGLKATASPQTLSRSVNLQIWQMSAPGAFPVNGPGSTASDDSSTDGNVGYSGVDENNPSEEDLRKIRVVYREDETVRHAKEISRGSLPGAHAANPVSSSRRVEERGGHGTLDAVLVQEDLEETGVVASDMLFDAKIVPDTMKDHRTAPPDKKLFAMLACIVLSAAGVLLPLFLIPSGSDTGGLRSPIPSSTPEPSQSNATLYPPFQTTLEITLLTKIQDPSSPHYEANKWMMEDPNLNSYSPERQRQRFYLALVYHATNGDHWIHRDHWMSYNTSECLWYTHSSLPEHSVYYVPNVCNTNESMTSLSLANNNLTGGLPLFPTAMLPDLRAFDVGDNKIGGTVPAVYSNPNLEVFVFSNNDFAGTCSSVDNRFDFPNFKVCLKNGNRLTAGTPNLEHYVMIETQHSLEVFNTSDNVYDGTIPTQFGLVTNLVYFGRQDNLVIGPIPSEMGLLRNVQGLDLGGNPGINGTVPTELGGLTALTHLDISGTALAGSIPVDLCARVREGTLEVIADCSLVDCCL